MTELITAVETLNRTWLERRFDDLTALFDENAIMRGPKLLEIGRGRRHRAGTPALVQRDGAWVVTLRLLLF
ncbi:MAG: hypothetical protein ABI693_00765 [Bryobacteraceae bacterium]